MATYRQLLAQVRDQGGSLQPPCDEHGLDVLRGRLRAELGIGLPAELADLLRVANGLNWNGLYLYPSATTALAGHPDVVLAGLVEANLDHREVGGIEEGLEDVLVFGDDSLDLYAWRGSTGEFQVLDKVPRDVIATAASFDELLSGALRRSLAH